jgi:hypothetical protein
MPGEVRERDRYGRASLREQWADELATLRMHPGVIALLVVLFGGWLVLQFTQPANVKVKDLAPGDCLYIHAADADTDSPTGRPAGTSTAAVTALYDQGAERAACGASHSHEVMAVFSSGYPAGAAYPGTSALREPWVAPCTSAFTAWVGRAPEGSELEPVLAVPNENAWSAGVRTGACLVARSDGQFLGGSAKGSGR